MRNINQINTENRTYYFFDDMINIKNFDSSSPKLDKKPFKNNSIYYVGNIATKN